MATCDILLTSGFINECEAPTSKILGKWYINFSDIDKTKTQVDLTKNSISKMILVSGAKIFKLEANPSKTTLSNVNTAFVSGDYYNGFTHSDTYTILNPTAAQLVIYNQLSRALVVSIVEIQNKGFFVFGFNSGMSMNESAWATSENNGVLPFTMSTDEGAEPNVGYSFVDTDYKTTAAWIKTNTKA